MLGKKTLLSIVTTKEAQGFAFQQDTKIDLGENKCNCLLPGPLCKKRDE